MAVWGGWSRNACTQAALLGLLLLLSACGGGSGSGPYSGSRQANYTPPGPPEDPWGPYIQEASHRFTVPSRWIREVMRQESGGHQYLHGQPITSDAGAAGLMQIMPATYEELRERFSLGGDPYDPHDNIVAGTGYIADLYSQYGSPGFLAAYNAGPHRVDEYIAGRGRLPNETVNYLASIAPRLGNERPMTGPLAAYADTGGPIEVAAAEAVPRAYARAPRAGCWQDPDAAYDPDAPCRAPPIREPTGLVESGGFRQVYAAPVAPPIQRIAARAPSRNCWHDPDAAYDPDAPCRAPPMREPSGLGESGGFRPIYNAPVATPIQRVAARAPTRNCWHDPDAAYDPNAACQTPRQYSAPAPVRRAAIGGAWAVQVGAFSDPDQARRVAESVRSLAPAQLGAATAVLGRTAPFGERVLYRARLQGLSPTAAMAACSMLSSQHQTCVTVPPGQ